MVFSPWYHLAGVQKDIALLARTIAQFEPVSMLADGPSNAAAAKSAINSGNVTIISSIPIDDMWMRDSSE